MNWLQENILTVILAVSYVIQFITNIVRIKLNGKTVEKSKETEIKELTEKLRKLIGKE